MMTTNQNRRGQADAGKVVMRFLGGLVAAGVVGLVGLPVGAIASAISGGDGVLVFLALGIAAFASLGARMAWRGVASGFGLSFGIWVLGSIVAFLVSLLGLTIGYNGITSLPWIATFAPVGANVVHLIFWLQPDRSSQQ